MVSIVRLRADTPCADLWPRLAAEASAWAAAHGVALRDAIVLLPFAQHLPLARKAWAQAGGWMPRLETTQTLALSLRPPEAPAPTQLSFDTALDRVAARQLLRAQQWARAWQQGDAGSFDHAVAAMVQAAQAFARAAAAVAPTLRGAYWQRGRELLGALDGPGAAERLLARVAFEWAAAGAEPATDALFALRPSAWIIVQAGGAQALVQSLLSHTGGTPCLVLDTDADADDPFAHAAADASLAVCAGFEDEAQRCAAQVLAHLAQGVKPVALIAQDRLLVRRVRALLARRRVALQDETGWKLSTTRAAAAVASLLRAAEPQAATDEWLDWLKSCVPHWPGLPDAAGALQALEAAIRQAGWVRPSGIDPRRLPEAAARLWHGAIAVVGAFGEVRSQDMAGWLAALGRALHSCGAWALLEADDAGRQVLDALHLQSPPPGHAGQPMTRDEFARWADDALEEASFVPQPAGGATEAAVVVTPLERAMLRPFAAAVFGGCDEKRLGAAAPPAALLSDALAVELGLPGAAARRDAQTLAFAQLLRVPRVDFLRRLDDDGEPLGPSPLLERLGLARARAGRPIAEARDPRTALRLSQQPVARPQPAAAALLPLRLSASACEALRVCPYRFFALRLLNLSEAEELGDEVEKRDYGTWLHAVLQRFHATRAAPLEAAQEQARLHAVAHELQREMQLDDAAFLPFAATFARLAPRYVEWLHARDREGAQWLDGEVRLAASPAEWGGVEMHGVIDRVDSVPGEDGPVIQLIDYKTGRAQGLRSLVKQPSEDTQLAFYAALMAQQSDAVGDIGAAYLPLDEPEALKPVEHRDVAASAQRLVEGVGQELARLRAGAPMPALGEGRACDFCAARGLCRRDHWAPEGDAA